MMWIVLNFFKTITKRLAGKVHACISPGRILSTAACVRFQPRPFAAYLPFSLPPLLSSFSCHYVIKKQSLPVINMRNLASLSEVNFCDAEVRIASRNQINQICVCHRSNTNCVVPWFGFGLRRLCVDSTSNTHLFECRATTTRAEAHGLLSVPLETLACIAQEHLKAPNKIMYLFRAMEKWVQPGRGLISLQRRLTRWSLESYLAAASINNTRPNSARL